MRPPRGRRAVFIVAVGALLLVPAVAAAVALAAPRAHAPAATDLPDVVTTRSMSAPPTEPSTPAAVGPVPAPAAPAEAPIGRGGEGVSVAPSAGEDSDEVSIPKKDEPEGGTGHETVEPHLHESRAETSGEDGDD